MTTAIEKRQAWNRDKPLHADPLCVGCGGPHPFDTSVPSEAWNRVIRDRGLPDYLCTTCIVRAFVEAGEGFTAQLWGGAFHGTPIEVIVQRARRAPGLMTSLGVLQRAESFRYRVCPHAGGPDPIRSWRWVVAAWLVGAQGRPFAKNCTLCIAELMDAPPPA